MKKILLILFSLFTLTAFGQDAQNILLKAQLYEIITKLNLPKTEQAKFVALYTDYFYALRKAEQKPARPKTKPTEAEAEKIIKEDFAQPKRIMAVREAYYEKFHQLLTNGQILQIYDIERDINRKIIQEAEDRRRHSNPI